MRAIKNQSAHLAYCMDLASFALMGSFGAIWLGSVGFSVAGRARWVE